MADEAIIVNAYLFVVHSFTEFYTGYGYTASAYQRPIGREYWTDNICVRNLPKVELLRVQCNLPTAGPQSLPSEPMMKPQSTLVEQY
jgi:hypothetical protein